MESRKRYHDQSVVSLRNGIMEKEARVEELRVAIAAIEDSAVMTIPASSFNDNLPVSLYTSQMTLQDVERSVQIARKERDNLLKSLASLREDTAKIKSHIESMEQNPLGEENEGDENDRAVGHHDTKMIVEESDLHILLDLKHIQVERDFRIKQYEALMSTKEAQASKMQQQSEKLQQLQKKLHEKQHNMDQLYADRISIQQLLYQSQGLLQGAFDKVASEVRHCFHCDCYSVNYIFILKSVLFSYY